MVGEYWLCKGAYRFKVCEEGARSLDKATAGRYNYDLPPTKLDNVVVQKQIENRHFAICEDGELYCWRPRLRNWKMIKNGTYIHDKDGDRISVSARKLAYIITEDVTYEDIKGQRTRMIDPQRKFLPGNVELR